jgi:hypothetical protein
MLRWLFKNLWNEPWGIFILAPQGLQDLREHLRKFLVVCLPDGKNWFFRYYDPRLLDVYLSACTARELQGFFGPIDAFVLSKSHNKFFSFRPSPTAPSSSTDQAVHARPAGLWPIRSEQLTALSTKQRNNFVEKMVAYLTRTFPQEAANMKDDELLCAVDEAIDSARGYGIISESEIARYLHFTMIWGAGFDKRCDFAVPRAVLTDKVLSGREKLDRLTELVRFAPKKQVA